MAFGSASRPSFFYVSFFSLFPLDACFPRYVTEPLFCFSCVICARLFVCCVFSLSSFPELASLCFPLNACLSFLHPFLRVFVTLRLFLSLLSCPNESHSIPILCLLSEPALSLIEFVRNLSFFLSVSLCFTSYVFLLLVSFLVLHSVFQLLVPSWTIPNCMSAQRVGSESRTGHNLAHSPSQNSPTLPVRMSR